MEVSAAIKLRQSVRAYKPDQITEEELQAVLTAAQNAPCAMKMCERMHLTVVQDPAILEELNVMAAKSMGRPDARPTYDAPTLIFVSHLKECEDILMGVNVSCVMENMLLAATELGLGSCYLFGLSQANQGNPRLPELLKLPEGYRSVAAAAIGYPAEELTAREQMPRYTVDYLK